MYTTSSELVQTIHNVKILIETIMTSTTPLTQTIITMTAQVVYIHNKDFETSRILLESSPHYERYISVERIVRTPELTYSFQ